MYRFSILQILLNEKVRVITASYIIHSNALPEIIHNHVIKKSAKFCGENLDRRFAPPLATDHQFSAISANFR